MPRGYIDFVLYVDKHQDMTIAEQILQKLTTDRIKAKKPSIIFIAGDSGEGKSMTSVKIAELVEPDIDMDKQVIYTPFEYPDKLQWMLFNPESKGRHVVFMAEARELVKAKLWYTLINQSIADVNAMSRTVKPLIFIINSQDISDVDKENRRLLTYYGYVVRPLSGKVNLKLYKINKSRHTIDNPKMRLKKLTGHLVQNGHYKKFRIAKFKVSLPSDKIRKEFEDRDFKAKKDVILKKLDAMRKALKKDMPTMSRLEETVEFMAKEHAILKKFIGRSKSGKIRINKAVGKLFNLSKEDFPVFETMMVERLKKENLIED